MDRYDNGDCISTMVKTIDFANMLMVIVYSENTEKLS